MLDVMKKYFDENKLFFGVNCGTLGFLLNEIDQKSGFGEVKRRLDTGYTATNNGDRAYGVVLRHYRHLL